MLEDMFIRVLSHELKDPRYDKLGASRVYKDLFHTADAAGKLIAGTRLDRNRTREIMRALGSTLLPSDKSFPVATVDEASFVVAWNLSGRDKVQKIINPKTKLAACLTCFRAGIMQAFWIPADQQHPQGSPLLPAEWCRYCGTMIVETPDGKIGVCVPETAQGGDGNEIVKDRRKVIENVFKSIEGV